MYHANSLNYTENNRKELRTTSWLHESIREIPLSNEDSSLLLYESKSNVQMKNGFQSGTQTSSPVNGYGKNE